METQQRELEARLEREGCRIVDRDRETDWWADEIWTVESTWRPVGCRIWVSFLVDPMHSGLRRKGEHVWAIGVTSARPQVVGDANASTFPIRHGHWSDSLDQVMVMIQSSRERVTGNEAG